MRHRGWWIAGTLVLLTNLIVLLGVASNRSGEPEAVLELTERELPVRFHGEEDTGSSLRFQYEGGWRPAWFDRSKLEELGFDCSAPPDSADAKISYGRRLPRHGFLAFEYGGEPWRQWLEEQRLELERLTEKVEQGEIEPSDFEVTRRSYEIKRRTRSRLFPIDAGRDPRVLRERHPERDRILILPAVFRIEVYESWNAETESHGPSRLQGSVSDLLASKIHIGRGMAAQLPSEPPLPASGYDLDPFEDPEAFEPRYEVTLNVGGRNEPWVSRIRRID